DPTWSLERTVGEAGGKDSERRSGGTGVTDRISCAASRKTKDIVRRDGNENDKDNGPYTDVKTYKDHMDRLRNPK
ncbi:Hypothetical predicted protein, partial [Marmota monax]